MFQYYFLVQLPKFKITWIAARLHVVEGVDAHIDFLQLFGSIVEWSGGVLQGRYRHFHIGGEDGAIGAPDALGPYLKHFTHRQ